MGKETYSSFVEGMDEELKSVCLRDFVEDSVNGETFTPQQITSGLNLVAKHFSYNINVGLKPRPQKRFGVSRKGVDLFVITDNKNPFQKPASTNGSSVVDELDEEVLAVFSKL